VGVCKALKDVGKSGLVVDGGGKRFCCPGDEDCGKLSVGIWELISVYRYNDKNSSTCIVEFVIPLGSGYVGAGCASIEFQEIRLSG